MTTAMTEGAAATDQGPSRVVLITGMSGAGLSVALKALEDQGYEAIDNLRLMLVPALLQVSGPPPRPLALVIDSRTRDFSGEALIAHVEALRARPDLDVRLVFLECADEALQRRFTETRRRHPLAADRPVSDGIQRERGLLSPLKAAADLTIDTTQLSIHDLRRLISGHFQLEARPALSVFITSFSFRQGVPREADLLFDVRFLVNPHWDPDLRPLSGLDPAVARRIEGDPDFPEFFRRLTDLLQPLLPRYKQEGKSYLTIAIGCTGGRHRSVFVVERLAEWLRGQGVNVSHGHRDLGPREPDPRDPAPAAAPKPAANTQSGPFGAGMGSMKEEGPMR